MTYVLIPSGIPKRRRGAPFWCRAMHNTWALFWLQSVRQGMASCHQFQDIMAALLADIRARGPVAEDDTSIAAYLLRIKVRPEHRQSLISRTRTEY